MQIRKTLLSAKKQAHSYYEHLLLRMCGKHAPTRFIILTSPRSGSNLLSDNLRFHKNIHMYSEIFNIFSHSRDELDRVLKSPRSFVESIFKKKYLPSIASVGFKIFYSQANKHQLSSDLHLFLGIPAPGDNWKKKISSTQDYITHNYDTNKIASGFSDVWTALKEDTSLKIIHLKRENKLKQFLSLFRASVNDQWLSSGKKKSRDSPLCLEYHDCLNFFKKYTSFEHEFDDLFSKHNKISVTYEEYIQNRNSKNKEIQKFLNVPLCEDLSSDIVKQRTKSLSESVSNYKELKSKFKNTTWYNFFED